MRFAPARPTISGDRVRSNSLKLVLLQTLVKRLSGRNKAGPSTPKTKGAPKRPFYEIRPRMRPSRLFLHKQVYVGVTGESQRHRGTGILNAVN